MPYGWIVGGLGAGLALIILSIVVCICLRSSSCFTEPRGNSAKYPSGKSSHKFHILRKSSFCCASGRYVGSMSGDNKQATAEASHPPVTISKGMYGTIVDYSKLDFTPHISMYIWILKNFLNLDFVLNRVKLYNPKHPNNGLV